MKKYIGITLCLWIILLLTACGGTDASQKTDKEKGTNESSNADDLKEVSIMLDWYPNAVHSYIYAAKEKGFFEEEGIKVDIQFPTNTTDPLNLAAAGKVTLGLYYQPDVITARANENVPVKSVASIVRSPLNHVVFLDDSPIQSPKDLEGKKVGYPGIPLNEALLKTMVEHDGGDYSKVNKVDVGFELSPAVVSKRTDAVIGAYINHEVPVLENKGYDMRYFNPVDYGVPDYNELVLVTGDETWSDEKDAIQSFWKGAEKGYQFMKDNPDQALEILLNNQDESNFPLDKEVEQESLEVLLPKMEAKGVEFGSQDKKSWREVRDWMYQAGLIETKPNVNEMIVN
ncbi:ABC transporter substrate-binding protein, partial [Lentibacillus halophilus]